MRLSFLSVVGLVGSVIAAPIELAAQDSSVIDASIRRVANSMNRLDNAMKNRRAIPDFRAAEQETNNYIALSRDIIEELRFSAKEIRKGPNVNSFETLTFSNNLNTSTRMLQSIIQGWIDAKRIVSQANKKPAVLDTLLDAQDATIVYSDAIISKLPMLDQVLGTTFKSAYVSAIDQAINEYKR